MQQALDIFSELQAAVYAKFTSDPTLMSLITGIFDEAPAAQPFPYITLGNKTRVPWDTFGKSSWDVTIVIDVWTAIDSGDVGFQIVAEMDNLLHNKTVALTHYDNAKCVNELTTTAPEESQEVKHLVTRYRFWNSQL